MRALVVAAMVAQGEPIVPCGNALCVGGSGQSVTLGGTVQSNQGSWPDGGLAQIQPATHGAVLTLTGVQSDPNDGGYAAQPDIVIRSANSRAAGGPPLVSFRSNQLEVGRVAPNGAVSAPSIEALGDNRTLTVLGTQSGGVSAPDVVIGSAYSRTSDGKPVSFQAGGFELGFFNGVGGFFPAGLIETTGANPIVSTNWQSLFGTGFTFLSTVTDPLITSAFTFDTFFDKSIGPLFLWNNHGVTKLYLDHTGTLTSVADSDAPAFLDGTTTSGHLGLTCTPGGVTTGCYLFTGGRLPTTYWGRHGASTLGNSIGMQAGFLAEFVNPLKGDASDKKLMVDYLGGIWPSSGDVESHFGVCANYENAPVDDGGAGYYVMTDAGTELEGALRYAWDKHHWCFCNPTASDGGAIGTTGDGWLRVKDEQPCAL